MSKVKREKSTQLTSADGYDTKRMIFSDPVVGNVPDSNPPITFRRINISTLNTDGTVGDLIFRTERVFSFGVSENINPETKKVNGHVLPLCLWSRDGASVEEKTWTDTFDAVVEQCKRHLVDNREEINQYELTVSDLKKLNPMYWKKEKGKIVEGTGPTLYSKLIASKKHDKVLTMFYDRDGTKLNPMEILGKYCYATAAIKIESIFIGNKITLQVKLYEAELQLMETGMQPLLQRPKANDRLLTGKSTTMNDMEELDVEDTGSIQGSEDEAPQPKLKKKVKKVKKAD
jgi:hypothetical protein